MNFGSASILLTMIGVGFLSPTQGIGNGLLRVVVTESGLALTQGISSEGGRRVVVWAEVGDNPSV